MNTADDVSRFSLVFSLHFTLRTESPSKQLAHAVEAASQGLDYGAFRTLKKNTKKHPYNQAIRHVFYAKFALEHFLEKMTVASSKESIKAAFLDPVNIFSITFLHGTQMGTLISLARSDKTLKPGGHVVKSEGFCMHGEHNKGFGGINRSYISGNILADSAHAISYAMHNGLDFNKSIIEATRDPERGAETLAGELDKYLADFKDETKRFFFWQNFLHYDAPSHRVFNFQRLFFVIRALSPHHFETKVLPKLNDLISLLGGTQNEGKEINEKILKPILTFRLPDYTKEEIELIKLDIPVVFGSKNVTIVNFKKKHNNKLAYPILYSLCKEYVYKGTLKLNEDIQVVFTAREHIQRVKSYLKDHHVDLPVLDIDACLLASSFIRYKEKKQKYTLLD